MKRGPFVLLGGRLLLGRVKGHIVSIWKWMPETSIGKTERIPLPIHVEERASRIWRV